MSLVCHKILKFENWLVINFVTKKQNQEFLKCASFKFIYTQSEFVPPRKARLINLSCLGN